MAHTFVKDATRRFRLLQIHKDQNAGGKRQGDSLQDPSQKRRAAFGDITNVSTLISHYPGLQLRVRTKK